MFVAGTNYKLFETILRSEEDTFFNPAGRQGEKILLFKFQPKSGLLHVLPEARV